MFRLWKSERTGKCPDVVVSPSAIGFGFKTGSKQSFG